MFKLLNRFAWVIAIMTWLQFSFFVDRDWHFDNEWFLVFVIILSIVKFLILPSRFIESRLKFFAEALNKTKPLSWIISPSQEKEATISSKKEEIKEEVKYKASEINLPFDEVIPVKKEKIKSEETSKLSLAIKSFFSENLLAKLWWILVFLGVLFLLSLVYSAIWPVWKLIIGFAIWFSTYIAWVILEKKNLPNEWKILLWIWILINYLVILSGRYLVGDSVDNNILSTWVTFLFLIFNTIFAVVTSLVYKSRTLLLFSFIFAFINPFLVWGSSDNPYTLVWYSLIVAFGWMFLALKQKDFLLAIWVFILSNILFLIAPLSTDLHWIITLVWSMIVSIISILVVYRVDSTKLSGLFIWSYIFLILLLWNWGSYVKETTSFISYMITILLYFGIWIYYFLKTSFNSLISLLFFPILIILWLSFSWALFSIPLTLAIIVLLYLVWFNFIQDILPNIFKYFFFWVLWIYIFLSNSLLSFNSLNLDLYSFITVIIVSFIFIFTSYSLSKKKDLEFLYSIWTIWWILTLAPVIVISTLDNESKFYLSILAILFFAISNWVLPFINKNLIDNKNTKPHSNNSSWIKNLLIWIIAWLLFIWYELFAYWNEYFPGISLGLAFSILAIIYFMLAYFMLNKIWFEKVKKQEFSKNVIYTYLWVSISVFSLAIALIFSSYQAVISAIWLFEATLMFYFFYKTKESKVVVAWIVLFMIWIFKLFNLIDVVKAKDFIFLIPFTIIFISLVYNINFLDFIKTWTKRVVHDVLHILWIWVLGILLLEIIPSTWHGWSILWIVIFLSVVNIIYSYFSSKILKIFFLVIFTWFLVLQIGGLDSILWKIDRDKIWYLRVLQYITTIIVWAIVLFWNRINIEKTLNPYINIVFWIYLLIITSSYVYDIFNTTFAVTIYWWISASIMLFYGISKDVIKLRTLWLYLITLTSAKIFLYDIWYGIDNWVSRVIALIVLWILFIIISTRYTKIYWNNLKWEFKFSNFVDWKKIKVKKYVRKK